MLRIVSHIESLLVVHDCVIVPRFGGFVLCAASASYRANEHLFCPRHREISFNTTLRYNDGLLTEAYMKMYGVDYHKAYRMVEDDVDEIKNMLYRGTEVFLGAIGSFSLGKENQIIFHSSGSGFQSMESYGLHAFQLKTLQVLQREEAIHLSENKKTGEGNVFYIPINRRWIQGIAGVAAAIAMFLVVSIPVKQIDTEVYTANFIPTEAISASNPSVIQPTSSAVVSSPVPVQKKAVLPQQKNKDVYYVVVSSMNSEKQADAFISQMDRSIFKNVDKLVETQKVRVYAAKFNNREKADVYMNKLRENPKYKDAWVYIP